MNLFAFLGFAALLAAQLAAAETRPELVPLEQQLAALAHAQPTELGIALFDPRSNLSLCINCEAAFPIASTVKVAVAIAEAARAIYYGFAAIPANPRYAAASARPETAK
jgi:beta-lactamase class A